MKTVKSVTASRGFLKDLFKYKFKSISFEYNEEDIYEVNSKLKRNIASIVKCPIFSHFGVFKVVSCTIEEDYAFSYNRFLKSNKPYIMLIENPLAPVHYCIGRNSTYISKKRIKKLLSDSNLLGIVCLSKACESTLKNFYDIPEQLSVTTIYPLVVPVRDISTNDIYERSMSRNLKCLYISSEFELKGGADILKAMESLPENVELTIVTKINTVPDFAKEYIKVNQGRIKLMDFNLNKQELASLYTSAAILLNPTRQDSYSLVTLEAIKYGNVILSSDLYALSEMIEDGVNGFLTEPKFRIWTHDNMPNKEIWNHRKKTIYSSFIDESVVQFLINKITLLNDNRQLLIEMQNESLKKSTFGEFSEKHIVESWEKVFSETGSIN